MLQNQFFKFYNTKISIFLVNFCVQCSDNVRLSNEIVNFQRSGFNSCYDAQADQMTNAMDINTLGCNSPVLWLSHHF